MIDEQLFCLWSDIATSAQKERAIRLILEHLKLEIWLTNSTQSGNTEMVIREKEE